MSLATWPEVVLAGQPLDWTRHVAALVRSGEILEDPRVSLVGEGLARGERVISIIDHANRPELIGALGALAVDVAAALDSRQLVVLDWEETYVPNGLFDPALMLANFRRWLGGGRGDGAAVTRVVADMAWTLASPPGVHRLGEYEAKLDDYLRRLPDVVICVYDLARHDAGTIADVLAHHPLTLAGGVLRPAAGPRPPSSARSRILTAASDLFSEVGVRATGVDTIIGTAGVAKATFYRHFPSKDDLIVAWLEDPRTRWFDRVRSRAETSTSRPEEVIPLLFEAVADWLEADEFRGCPYLNTAVELSDPGHPARPVIRRYLEDIETHLTELGEGAGLAHPAMVASELQTLLAGAISLAVARRTSAFALSAREAAVRLITAAERA